MAKTRTARRDPPPARQLATKPLLQRLYWALGRLRSNKPLKAKDIAEEFEVNVRTAYRDLDFLRDRWRVPIEYDRTQATYRLTEPMADLRVAGGGREDR